MTTKIHFFEHDKNSYYKKHLLYKKGIFLNLVLFLISVFILTPTTSLAQTCLTVGSTQLVFGQYDPIAEGPLDIDTTIEFNCPPAFRGRIIIASIRFIGFSNGSAQSISNTSGAGKLEVGIFTDPLRRRPIDGNTIIPIIDFNSQNQTFRITLYGRIEPKQKNVDVGNYFGKITLLLTYL
jgi:spore coat protein U-like protein